MLQEIGTLSESSLKVLKVLLLEGKEYLSSEMISEKTGLSGKALGASLSAFSKIKINNQPLIIPWGKKSMKVQRVRGGKRVEIARPIQVWKINQELFKNKKQVIDRIDEILKVLEG